MTNALTVLQYLQARCVAAGDERTRLIRATHVERVLEARDLREGTAVTKVGNLQIETNKEEE